MKKITMILLLVMIFNILILGVNFAVDIGDENGGPGIGMAESSYNNNGAIIYTDGRVTGITGDYVSASNTTVGTAPISVESNIQNPIDYSTIDMGPTSNYYQGNYSLHSIDDGGPGTGIITNELGNPMRYNDGGPGMGLDVKTNDGTGPKVIYNNITPEYALTDNGPSSSTEGYSKKKITTSIDSAK